MRCWLAIAYLLSTALLSQASDQLLVTQPAAVAPSLGEPITLDSIVARLECLERENANLQAQVDRATLAISPSDAMPAGWYHEIDPCPANCDCHRCMPAKKRYPTLEWSGFIQLDTGWISQDEANKAAVGVVDAQTGLRRVRLRADGKLRRDVSYVVDLDFAASGHPSFRDVAFTIHDRPLLQNVQLGYFQQPFGFEAMTSGRELLLLERQLPFAFVPFRQTGVGASGTAIDELMSWSFSGYRFPTDSFGVSQGGNGGWGYASRLTTLMLYDQPSGSLVHAGFSYSFIDPGNDVISYAIEPGFFVTDPDDTMGGSSVPVFVDTGNIPTQNVNLAAIEFAAQFGSLNLQAEAINSFVDQTGGPYLGFSGAWAKVAYVLSGEVHPYNRQRGVFTSIRPRTETTLCHPRRGAWEVVAAWAYIDLNDQNIAGGEMQTCIVGINRYLNDHVKLQLNVIRALLNDPDSGYGEATLVAMRAQAEF